MRADSDIPRDRAYRLAMGMSSGSTVIVSFFFISLGGYVGIRTEDLSLRAIEVEGATSPASPEGVAGKS